MNHQPPAAAPVGEQVRPAPSLEQRLAAHPPLYQRVSQIVDIVEREVTSGCTADQAEAKVRDQLRALGQEVLQLWASGTAVHAAAQARAAQPGLIKHRKKNSTGTPPSGASRSANNSCAAAGAAGCCDRFASGPPSARAVTPRGCSGC